MIDHMQRIQVLFSDQHEEPWSDENAIVSFTEHTLYDVIRHRIQKPPFSSTQAKTISQRFQKSSLGSRFKKILLFSMRQKAVYL